MLLNFRDRSPSALTAGPSSSSRLLLKHYKSKQTYIIEFQDNFTCGKYSLFYNPYKIKYQSNFYDKDLLQILLFADVTLEFKRTINSYMTADLE
jgi:hypothetical protein